MQLGNENTYNYSKEELPVFFVLPRNHLQFVVCQWLYTALVKSKLRSECKLLFKSNSDIWENVLITAIIEILVSYSLPYTVQPEKLDHFTISRHRLEDYLICNIWKRINGNGNDMPLFFIPQGQDKSEGLKNKHNLGLCFCQSIWNQAQWSKNYHFRHPCKQLWLAFLILGVLPLAFWCRCTTFSVSLMKLRSLCDTRSVNANVSESVSFSHLFLLLLRLLYSFVSAYVLCIIKCQFTLFWMLSCEYQKSQQVFSGQNKCRFHLGFSSCPYVRF